MDRRAKVDEKLKELDKEIKEKFRSRFSGIYLSSSDELFHSKGYLVESQKYGICAVGSLNITQKGLMRNGEFLAFCDYQINSKSYASKFSEHFKKYVERILDDEKTTYRVSDSEATGIPSGTSRRDCFLEGKLYYEANEVGPFGFKLDLPADSLTGQSYLGSYFEAKTSDILDVRELIGLKSEENKGEKSERSLWKRYCFHTCYGYWAPECHFEDIKVEIEKNEGRVEIYKNTFDVLQERSEELWSELLRICRDLAPRVGNNWKFLSNSQDLDEEKLHQRWSDWFCKLMNKKED